MPSANPHPDTVGITSIGHYIPPATCSASEMAEMSGIPEFVYTEKIGIERKHIASPDEHPSEMVTKSARIRSGMQA